MQVKINISKKLFLKAFNITFFNFEKNVTPYSDEFRKILFQFLNNFNHIIYCKAIIFNDLSSRS